MTAGSEGPAVRARGRSVSAAPGALAPLPPSGRRQLGAGLGKPRAPRAPWADGAARYTLPASPHLRPPAARPAPRPAPGSPPLRRRPLDSRARPPSAGCGDAHGRQRALAQPIPRVAPTPPHSIPAPRTKFKFHSLRLGTHGWTFALFRPNDPFSQKSSLHLHGSPAFRETLPLGQTPPLQGPAPSGTPGVRTGTPSPAKGPLLSIALLTSVRTAASPGHPSSGRSCHAARPHLSE